MTEEKDNDDLKFVTFRFPRELADKLRIFAAMRNVSQQDTAIEAVTQHLEKELSHEQ